MKSIRGVIGLGLALCLSLSACASTSGAGVGARPAPVTAEEQPLLDAAVSRGRMIYGFDQAAWHSTDLLRAKLPQRMPELLGWVVEGDADNQTVTYYGGSGDSMYAIFKADMRRDQVAASHEVRPGDADRELTAVQRRMIQAQDNAARAITTANMTPCDTATFNPVVMPPAADGSIDVYLLTPMVRMGVYPAGGHYLARVGADGKVQSTRRFTYACADLGDGTNRPEFFAMTHLLDATPTEIQVWLSIQIGKPFYILMRENLWVVFQGQITKLASRSLPGG